MRDPTIEKMKATAKKEEDGSCNQRIARFWLECFTPTPMAGNDFVWFWKGNKISEQEAALILTTWQPKS